MWHLHCKVTVETFLDRLIRNLLQSFKVRPQTFITLLNSSLWNFIIVPLLFALPCFSLPLSLCGKYLWLSLSLSVFLLFPPAALFFVFVLCSASGDGAWHDTEALLASGDSLQEQRVLKAIKTWRGGGGAATVGGDPWLARHTHMLCQTEQRRTVAGVKAFNYTKKSGEKSISAVEFTTVLNLTAMFWRPGSNLTDMWQQTICQR